MIKLVAVWCPPKRSKRVKQQPITPTGFYTQKSHKYTKLEVIIYVQRTCFRAMQGLCMLLQSLEFIRDFIIVDLKGLVFLLSSMPSGSYILPSYTSTWFSDPLLQFLILYIMSGCSTLYFFPSAARENFSDNDLTRH